MTGNRIRVIGRAKTNVRIGYTTHNGAERVIAHAETRELALRACAFANQFDATLRERGEFAISRLKTYRNEKAAQ